MFSYTVSLFKINLLYHLISALSILLVIFVLAKF